MGFIRKYKGYIVLAVVLLFVANIFYIVGYLHPVADRTYTGINIFNYADKLVYQSMVWQGSQGVIMMNNLYTSEAQKGLLFSPHWWLIGETARVLGWSIEISMNVWRLLLGLLLICVMYLWIKRLFNGLKARLIAFGFVCGAGTMGWWLLAGSRVLGTAIPWNGGKYPPDIVTAEIGIFSGLQQAPLVIISHLVMLVLFYLFIAWNRQWSWQRALIWAGSLFIFLLIHPYDILIMAPVLTIWSYWQWRQQHEQSTIWYWLTLAIGAGLAGLYLWLCLRVDPVIAGWASQNITLTPPIGFYLFGLAPYIILSLVGSVTIGRRHADDPWWRLMLIWTWIIWIIAYLPDQVSHRAVNAWLIPLTAVSCLGLQTLLRHWPRPKRILLIIVVSILCLGSSVYSLIFQLQSLPDIQARESFYMSNDLQQTFQTLRAAARPGDTALASDQEIALMVPAYTGVPIFVAQSHQTVDYLAKDQEAKAFWTSDNSTWQRAFLQRRHITLVVVRRGDPAINQQHIQSAIGSQPILQNDSYTLYRVAVDSATTD